MTYLRQLFYAIAIVSGLFTAWDGVKEFDHATTPIPLLRGLFWGVIGVYVFWFGIKGSKKEIYGK